MGNPRGSKYWFGKSNSISKNSLWSKLSMKLSLQVAKTIPNPTLENTKNSIGKKNIRYKTTPLIPNIVKNDPPPLLEGQSLEQKPDIPGILSVSKTENKIKSWTFEFKKGCPVLEQLSTVLYSNNFWKLKNYPWRHIIFFKDVQKMRKLCQVIFRSQ